MRARAAASWSPRTGDERPSSPAEVADSGAAMITSLLAILISATMSMIALAVIVNEVMPTSYLQASSQTIFAAEAGVNTVLGQMRTAEGAPDFMGVVYGDTSLLPCSAAGPVDGASGDLTYEVTVRYFADDPTSQSATWLDAHDITCASGAGPVSDPTYALITSTGIGLPVAGLATDAGDRQVQAVYEFQVTNNNIPGGLIYNFDENDALSGNYCLQAENAIVGSYVKYVPEADCGTDDVRQLWIYDKTYQIKLASTTVPSLAADPLCVTRPSSGTLPQRVTLQVCKNPTDSSRWTQLFSWEGGARFNGENSTITDYAGVYLSAGATSLTTGSYLQAWGTAANMQFWGSFNPDPRVGAGAASYATTQIVSYLEFGRCFDVTDEDPNKTFMIVYPCKQDPSGGTKLLWNHKWTYSEPVGELGSLGTQQIWVKKDGVTYCLVSPLSEGGYATLTSSCNTAAPNQRWTRNANTGDYATSYTFTDSAGRCISLGGPGASTGPLRLWSTLVTASCNGSLSQKWNAPANTVSASVGGYQEIS